MTDAGVMRSAAIAATLLGALASVPAIAAPPQPDTASGAERPYRLAQSAYPWDAEPKGAAPKAKRQAAPPGGAAPSAGPTPAPSPSSGAAFAETSSEEVVHKGQRVAIKHDAASGQLRIELNGRVIA